VRGRVIVDTTLLAGNCLIDGYCAIVGAGVVEDDVVGAEVGVLVSTLWGRASRSREQYVLKGALEL
jgi:hypothetical protein